MPNIICNPEAATRAAMRLDSVLRAERGFARKLDRFYQYFLFNEDNTIRLSIVPSIEEVNRFGAKAISLAYLMSMDAHQATYNRQYWPDYCGQQNLSVVPTEIGGEQVLCPLIKIKIEDRAASQRSQKAFLQFVDEVIYYVRTSPSIFFQAFIPEEDEGVLETLSAIYLAGRTP